MQSKATMISHCTPTRFATVKKIHNAKGGQGRGGIETHEPSVEVYTGRTTLENYSTDLLKLNIYILYI